MPARDLDRLAQEIAKAKARFQLPPDAPVCTCYEAGRDGFWLHRALTQRGIHNVVVDSSSIEVDRRCKRVKTDPVDAAKLLNLLCRYHGGERKVWSVVHVPEVADEDRRQLHRGLKDLQRQQTEVVDRFGSGTPQRRDVTDRLRRIYSLAIATGHLDRLVIFGSYVSEVAEPKDVDIILVMRSDFAAESCPADSRTLFDHARADDELGASIFWIRPEMLLGEPLEQFLPHWEWKRDGSRRGIVEIRP